MKIFYKLFISSILLLFCASTKAQNEFITEWSITGTSLQFPGIGSGYTLVWENVNNPASTGTITNAVNGQPITLPAAGSYRIKASNGSGEFVGFNANTYTTNRMDLKFVRQWGNIQWNALKAAFYFCSNLDVTATDVPDLTLVKDLSLAFCGASSLKGNNSFNDWNTQNVTDMSGIFANATAFNQPIGNWNTQNVTNMSHMFTDATAFNQPIGNWNTQNVRNMTYMFFSATAFNQPIGNWNTQNVTNMYGMFTNASTFNQPIGDWNTKNVTDMSNMLYDASAFNQPVNNWNVAKVTNMSYMFTNATAFNQPVNNWNVAKVTNMGYMLNGANAFNQSLANWNLMGKPNMNQMLKGSGLDCKNYSATLIGWANLTTTPTGLILNADGLFYNSSAQAARDKLVNQKGWTIKGDFYNAGCGITTPISFGDFSAIITGNTLSVSWHTISESNNKAFVIEISKNGIDNWQKVATIASKAQNGDSATVIDYSTHIPLTTAMLAAMSLLAISLVPGKRYKWPAMFLAIVMAGSIYSCSKNEVAKDMATDTKIYVRLSQTDKDGAVKILGIKEAVRK